jgi:signal peptidase
MQPAFSAGDLVIARPVPVASLVVGDVIVFVPPGHNQAVAHRIAAINAGSITSRGDANPVDDPWQVQLSGPTVERVVATVPYLGWSSQLERPLLAMAALLVGAVLLFELWKEVGKRFKRT